MLTTREVAERSGASVATLNRWVQAGVFPAVTQHGRRAGSGFPFKWSDDDLHVATVLADVTKVVKAITGMAISYDTASMFAQTVREAGPNAEQYQLSVTDIHAGGRIGTLSIRNRNHPSPTRET